jgi:hypothetical protein
MTGVYEGEQVDLRDGPTLIAALRGSFGPEWQAYAAEMAELEIEEDEGEFYDEPEFDPEFERDLTHQVLEDRFGQEIASQAEQWERKHGRKLTETEWQKIVDDHGTSDEVDVEASYDRVIGRDPNRRGWEGRDDARAIATEVYEEHRAAQEREKEGDAELAGGEEPEGGEW